MNKVIENDSNVDLPVIKHDPSIAESTPLAIEANTSLSESTKVEPDIKVRVKMIIIKLYLLLSTKFQNCEFFFVQMSCLIISGVIISNEFH